MPTITLVNGDVPEGLSGFEIYQIYNCIDSCITAQLVAPMKAQLKPETTGRTYDREMNYVALCLAMFTDGLPIDHGAVLELLHALSNEVSWAQETLAMFCEAIGYRTVNPNSPQQVIGLLHDFLRVPSAKRWDHKTKTSKVDTSREKLEKHAMNYPISAPFINAILGVKEPLKMASVFRKGAEPDGRFRPSTSPSATTTGRFASQQNPFNRGTNGQNLTDKARAVFVAPDGYTWVNGDLKTAESVAVAYLSKDASYIAACSSGDLHTAVARDVWPNLGWSGENKQDRALAELPFYRHFSYRDMSKRGGHGTNYYGKPATMARHLHVETKVMEDFQRVYFNAFPGIAEWQQEVIVAVQQQGVLINPLGRERRFWGHPGDETTYRQAIAYGPQSLVGDIENEGLVACKKMMVADGDPDLQLNLQIHDAGLFLIPTYRVHELIPKLEIAMQVPVDFGPLGTMLIGTDWSVGKNWRKRDKKGLENPAGLRDYQPGIDLANLA